MKINILDDTVTVTDLPELGEEQAAHFQREVSAALAKCPGLIEVDLGQTATVDCAGLGAMVAVFDHARELNRGAKLRVVNPTPPVRQLLELTRLHKVFLVINRPALPGQKP